jgi:omega-6 fatty acid desaturase (delta-12 desaturase)
MSEDAQANAVNNHTGWKSLVAPYQKPEVAKSAWQIVNSFGGFLLMLVAMYFSLRVGYWLTLLLAIPTAGFLVRIFIIQHDCGHGSFFKSGRANDIAGTACSLFTGTAYKYWRKSHAVHHATHAELEQRGTGDIWTMTVDEYLQASLWKRSAYRVFRNPVFLFGIAPALNFIFAQRLPLAVKPEWHNGERASVWLTNLALLGVFTTAGLILGFWTVLAIYLPVTLVAGTAGVWLFYVQHQFERTYWEHTPEWNYTLAALHGSSYYKLPKVLQWFSGNIGFHHIHHLSPRIPNYRLEACYVENPMMQQAPTSSQVAQAGQ